MRIKAIIKLRQSQISFGRGLCIFAAGAALIRPPSAGASAPPVPAPPPALTNATPSNPPAAGPAPALAAPASAAAATAPADAVANEPLRQYLQAHESMAMAEWLKQQDLQEEAADIYREALGVFKELAQKHPEWKTDLVDFRIKHCEKELAAMSGTAAAPGAQRPALPGRSQSPALGAARNTARLRQAVQLEKVADLPAALALYQEILDGTPQHLPALQGAARVYMRMQRMAPARAVLEQAAQLPENDDATLLLRATLLCHDGDFHGARRLLDMVIKRNPYNANAHLIMGAVLADAGQLGAAEEATNHAISLNPKLGDAYYNRAQISLHQQPIDLEKTKHHYRNALKYGSAPDPALEALLD